AAAAMPAQRAGSGVGRCPPCRVDDGELAVLGKWRLCYYLVQRAGGRVPEFHEVEDLWRQGGVGDVLGGYGAHAAARPGAARCYGRAGGGHHETEHPGARATAHQRERHGFTATAVTSTSHSGRASAWTTRPVKQGCTPFSRSPSTR